MKTIKEKDFEVVKRSFPNIKFLRNELMIYANDNKFTIWYNDVTNQWSAYLFLESGKIEAHDSNLSNLINVIKIRINEARSRLQGLLNEVNEYTKDC